MDTLDCADTDHDTQLTISTCTVLFGFFKFNALQLLRTKLGSKVKLNGTRSLHGNVQCHVIIVAPHHFCCSTAGSHEARSPPAVLSAAAAHHGGPSNVDPSRGPVGQCASGRQRVQVRLHPSKQS